MKTATVSICSFGLSRFAVLYLYTSFFIDALVRGWGIEEEPVVLESVE